MKFLAWCVRNLIPHHMGCEEFFYAMKFLTFWVLRNFDSSQVFYLIKIMGIRFLNRRLGKNQIPNPREGKKFLILGKEKKNSSPSGFALGWGIFFLPLDEEFLTFPWVRNLILPQLPVEEALIFCMARVKKPLRNSRV